MNTHISLQECSSIHLITASGEPLPIVDCVDAPIEIAGNFTTKHQLVVDLLIYPVILGTDFLHKHHVCLDFTCSQVTVQQNMSEIERVQPLWEVPKPSDIPLLLSVLPQILMLLMSVVFHAMTN